MEIENRKKELIRAFIEDKNYRPMKLREMAGILQVPKSDRGDLGAVLDELLREGIVSVDAQGRYAKKRPDTFVGEYLATGRGFGFVRVEGEDEDIFIPADKEMGAIHGDRVEIAILTEAGVSHGRTLRAEGIVCRILEHSLKEIVGVFRKNKHFGFVIPDNQKIDFQLYIAKEHTKGAVNGQKVVARITDYGNAKHSPEGRITEILGHIGDPGVDILSVVKAYGLYPEFPEEEMREVENTPTEISEKEVEGRLDLRHLPTVTIDGDDAKDLDDAISISFDGELYSLGVHIADVSHYVREHSALDEEAIRRGTSVYLTDRVIPMLPHALSNGICSLNAGEDRLALSCLMEVDRRGVVVSHRIAETVIRVDKRMSYGKVRAILEEHDEAAMEEYDGFVPQLEQMAELSEKIRTRRQERGAIDFDFPESKILLNDHGKVVAIEPYSRNVATKLIEDFMLLANETVAEEFFWLELPFVYRSHENPDSEKMKKLNIFINNFGYSIHLSGDEIHAKELQKLLNRIQGTPEEVLISRLTLRSMKQAKYTTNCSGHFGLASKYYCHFTSPIRRYPDLQIHRIIKEYLHGTLDDERLAHYATILPERARTSSEMERRAEEAEREVDKMKKVEYMQRFIGEEFEGVVSGVTGHGMYVELPNTVEGMIRMADLRGDYYRYDESTQSLIGEHTKKKYSLGQRIRVQLVAADKLTRTIDFIPAMN